MIGVLAVVFFISQVPETKGRSLEEIQEDVTGRRDRTRRHRGRGASASHGHA